MSVDLRELLIAHSLPADDPSETPNHLCDLPVVNSLFSVDVNKIRGKRLKTKIVKIIEFEFLNFTLTVKVLSLFHEKLGSLFPLSLEKLL